jgi:hypothetical protein
MQIEEIQSRVAAPSRTFNMNSLLHIRQVSQHQQDTFWHLIITTTLSALAILGILYLSFLSRLHSLVTCRRVVVTKSEPSTVDSSPSPVTPEPTRRTHLPKKNELNKKLPSRPTLCNKTFNVFKINTHNIVSTQPDFRLLNQPIGAARLQRAEHRPCKILIQRIPGKSRRNLKRGQTIHHP